MADDEVRARGKVRAWGALRGWLRLGRWVLMMAWMTGPATARRRADTKASSTRDMRAGRAGQVPVS